MTNEEANKIIGEAAAKLGEHFDAVQILASWNEEGISTMSSRGCGNWYARQGMAHEFITSDLAQDAAVQIAERLAELRDGGGEWPPH